MKRVLLSIMALTIAIVMCRAERNVSTEEQYKNVLVEEFTGIHCGYCPYAHKIVADMLKAQPEKVYAIAVHAGHYSVPNSDEPDFRISEGTEINNYFGITGYPAGMVNRQRYDDRIIINRSSWATVASMETQIVAPVNLWMKSSFDESTRTLTVDVEGYYTADGAADFNLLNVVVTENNIMGPQSGGGLGSEYMHQHMARAYLTSTWGDTITTCKKGDFFAKQYTYKVPETIKEVAVNPAELEVVAYVTANEENVLNVIGSTPEYAGVELPLNAEIAQSLIPITGVYGYDYFDIDLKNRSTQAITSATFTITFNSTDYEVEWTGEAAPRATTTIRLPFDVTSLAKEKGNRYTIKLTGLNGTDYKGNKLTDKFDAPATTTPTVIIEFYLDEFAAENRFLIKDMEGNIVQEFGPYASGEYAYTSVKEILFLEPNTRYCFEITDAWSNGIYDGYAKVYDNNNVLVSEIEVVEVHGARTFFNTAASNASQEVQTKKVFIEDFTGIHCGNCPDAHYMIAELMKAQPEKIHAVAIHAGHYAVAFPGEPDFRTPEGDSLDIYFETPGYPYGMINRTLFEGEEEYMTSRGGWVEYSRAISDQVAPVNLWVGSVYDSETRILTVNVEGYYTADVDANFNALNVLISQSGIVGPQNGGSAGNNYVHNHVARAYLTPIWGDTITTCKKGDSFTRQYLYEVPADINGVATNVANFEVLAYVCIDKTDVLNVTASHPLYPGLVLPLSAEIQKPLIPVTGTYAYNYYEVLMTNNSTEDIVEAGFDIKLNDNLYKTEWTGLVPARSTRLIQVPFNQSALISTVNDFSIKLGALNYQLYDGNGFTGSFQDPLETTPYNKVIIKTDNFADENRYLIKDMSGNIVHEFGPYPYGTITEVTEEITLEANKVYCLEITDAWGNGIYKPRGTCKIYNENGKLVAQMLEIKDHGIRTFFATTLPSSGVDKLDADNNYGVQYNKADAAINVVANGNETYNVVVYNAAGQCVYAGQATASIAVPVRAEGVYVVEVTSATAHKVAKVVVY
ncbi:MAG: Omp28-related outer membrane protein [Bacteroidaceae bacterium]|nr:Omp28-related outer membrane protein [Bacteroidaceae bacterium]